MKSNFKTESPFLMRTLTYFLAKQHTFKSNTESFTRNRYKRMSISLPIEHLVNIYILFIRSVLEQSAVVWNSSITKREQFDIERVQKSALIWVILKKDYISCEDSLVICDLETLKARQNKLTLSFAIKCTKNENTRDISQNLEMQKSILPSHLGKDY